MPKRPIDLEALARVVGKAPPRYAAGDPRNTERLRWWGRATRALGALLAANAPPKRTYLEAMQARERAERSWEKCAGKLPPM